MATSAVIKNILLYIKPIKDRVDALYRRADNGVISLDPVGITPNAYGGSITGSTLQLQPANDAFPGVVTAAAQTIGGLKTFSSGLSLKEPVGTDTVTLSAPALAGSLNLTLPSVNGSANQVMTTNGAGTLSWQNTQPTVFVGNTLYVDCVYGNDATAVANNPAKPWITLTAALNATAEGDVVIVNPGTYNEGNLWRKNVNLYFLPETIVDTHDNIFRSEDVGPWAFNVYGYGKFISDGNVVYFDVSDGQNVYIEAISMESRNNNTISIGKSTNEYFINVQRDIICSSSDPTHSAIYFKGGFVTIKARNILGTQRARCVYSSDLYIGTLTILCLDIICNDNSTCEFTSGKENIITILANNIVSNAITTTANAISIPSGDTKLKIVCTEIIANGVVGVQAYAINAASGALNLYCNKISNNNFGTSIRNTGGTTNIYADIVYGNNVESTINVSGGTLNLFTTGSILGVTGSAISITGGNAIVQINAFNVISTGTARAISLSGTITRFNIKAFTISTAGAVCYNAAAGFSGRVNLAAQTIEATGGIAFNIISGTHYITIEGSSASNTTSVINITGGTVTLNVFLLTSTTGTIRGLTISGGTVSGIVNQIQSTGNCINISGGTVRLSNSYCGSTAAGTISISGGTVTLFCQSITIPASQTGISQSGAATTEIYADTIISSAANVFGASIGGTGTFTLNCNIVSTTLQAIFDSTSGTSTFIVGNYCRSTTAPTVMVGNSGTTYLKIANVQALVGFGVLVNSGTVYGSINSIVSVAGTVPAIGIFSGTKAYFDVDFISSTGACFKCNANVPSFLSVREATSSTEACIVLTNTTSQFTFEGIYKCTWANAAGYGLQIIGPAVPVAIIKNAVFVTSAIPVESITSNVAATPLRVYGHAMSNKALSANITQLCGTYEVSASVI